MKISTENFRDPVVRQEAASLFREYTRYDPIKADQVIEEYFSRPSSQAVVARSREGEFLGFGLAALAVRDAWYKSAIKGPVMRPSDQWVILELHVAGPYRHSGIGTALLWKLECQSPHRGMAILGVDESNVAARRLYWKSHWSDLFIRFKPPGFTSTQLLYGKDLGSFNPSSPMPEPRQSPPY